MKNSVKISHSRGFTLAEVLIALFIVGLILAAITAALQASVMNYRQNEDIFKNINKARQALVRMTSQIRTGIIDPNNIADQSECIVLCSDGSSVRYHYDNVADKLYLYDYNTASDYLLCDNVTALSFIKDNSTPTGDVKSVRISITVSQNGNEQKLAAAAVVRKVLEW